MVALGLAGQEARSRRKQERRRQAEGITAWIAGPPQPVEGRKYPVAKLVVQNASDQLAYRLIATSVEDSRGIRTGMLWTPQGVKSIPKDTSAPRDGSHDFRAFVGELPPGRLETQIEYKGGWMNHRAQVELAFRDAAGRHWLRKGTGELREIGSDPASHYGFFEPLPWLAPEQG